jgi:NAD(P)-dependent dehydrogenase (short-subunit alcohol dehydrogenase family)
MIEDKIVVVTGSAQGIGKHAARARCFRRFEKGSLM